MIYWTLVQHTGYTVGGKPGFKNAAEVRQVDAKALAKIAKHNALIFNTYSEADKAEKEYNYPPENKTLYPSAKGEFKTVKGFDEPIFIPAPGA